MSKIKIVFYLVLIFIGYKGFVAFKNFEIGVGDRAVSYTHLRAHETLMNLVCRLLLEKKKH